MKKKEVHVHTASTLDTFYCMISSPKWVKLLIGNGKAYQPFLEKLINANFFKERDQRVTIKQMAETFGYKREQLTKWINEMYEDIFELNFDSPGLFAEEGVRHELYLRGYETSVSFTVWFKTTPRIYEKLNFFFMEAKVGSRIFWVSDVQHEVDENEHTITIWLQNGFCNKYRELLVDRGLFFGYLGSMDVYQKKDYEIDDQLKKYYKD